MPPDVLNFGVFVVTFFIPGFFGDLIPFFLFVFASFTDYLDGLLARLFKEESKLGELLDPIADKILVAAALILLVMNGTIKNYEVIAAIIIFTREIFLNQLKSLSLYLSRRKYLQGLFFYNLLNHNLDSYKNNYHLLHQRNTYKNQIKYPVSHKQHTKRRILVYFIWY